MNPLSLSQNLVAQIQNLVHGNGVKANDIIPQQHYVETFQAQLQITWQFVARAQEQTVIGGQAAERHFGDDMLAFQQHTEQLNLLAAHDTVLREAFIRQMVAQGDDALLAAQQEYRFYTFHPFSVEKPCQHCKGQGHIQCLQCHGRGGHHQQQGMQTCAMCAGAGKTLCVHCNGSGHVTLTRQIAAYAVPSFQVVVQSTIKTAELQHFLNQQSLAFCVEHIAFHLAQHLPTAANSYGFVFQGQQYLLKQVFALQGKQYTCYAFSVPPYPFIRPAIFDDILADDLDNLLNHAAKNNRAKNLALFHRCMKQAVLQQAVHTMTSQRTELATALRQACQQFISKPLAERLAVALSRLLDKISPLYALRWWQGITMVLALFGLFYTAYRTEVILANDVSSRLLSISLRLLLVALVVSAVAWLGSRALTVWRNRYVPDEYRHAPHNREPFVILLKTTLLFHLMGLIYGLLVAQSLVPSWQGQPFAYLLSHSQSYCVQQKIPQWLCGFTGKTLPQWLEINTTQLLAQYPASRPIKSTEEKVRYIQQQLKQAGYPVVVNGKFNSKTAQYAKEYLMANFGQANNTIDGIYQQMGGE